jgi:hypothetical protein
MKTFRKPSPVPSLPRAKRRGFLFKTLLIVNCQLLIACALCAQNGVTISDFSANVGAGGATLTFNVGWDKNANMPAVWSDTAWVFADYNNAGTMTRLQLTGATLTATTAPDVGKVIKLSGNNDGVWVVGNAKATNNTSGSFSATVKLFTSATYLSGACVYAINYPPVGQYTAANKIKLQGTPPFYLTYNTGSPATVTRAEAAGTYTLERTLLSFTDASKVPGTFLCALPNVQTLTASASGYCEGLPGVKLALSGTQSGVTYQLYKNNSSLNGVTMTGTGSPATFTGDFGQGAYYAQSVAGAFCAIAMSGTHTVTEIATPATPVIAVTSSGTVCQNGALTFYVASPVTGATYTWSASAGSQNSSSYTVTTSQAGAKTATVYARVAAGGVTCQSPNAATKTANVQATPAQPVITASAATVCQNEALTFYVASPVAGATYTWSASAGSQNGSSYTVTTSQAGAKTATVYARVTAGGVTCQSANAATKTAIVANTPDKPATPTHNGPKCAGTAITFTAVKPANATGLDWAGSVTGSGTETTKTTATSAGSYSAQVRAYITSGTTCYSGWSGATWSVINPNPTITRTGGNASQTVTINTVISPITYTATHATGISCNGCAAFPTALTGSAHGQSYTISGVPSATGTFAYTVTASHTNGCSSVPTPGTLTVRDIPAAYWPTHAMSPATYVVDDVSLSDFIYYEPTVDECTFNPDCQASDVNSAQWSVVELDGSSYTLYSYTCAENLYHKLCDNGWNGALMDYIGVRHPSPGVAGPSCDLYCSDMYGCSFPHRLATSYAGRPLKNYRRESVDDTYMQSEQNAGYFSGQRCVKL